MREEEEGEENEEKDEKEIVAEGNEKKKLLKG